MISLDEQLLTIRQAAKLFPGRTGRPISVSTIFRWLLAPGRRGVRLESIVCGGVRYTSREALQRFIEALNPSAAATQTIRTSPQRRRASERAATALAKVGI